MEKYKKYKVIKQRAISFVLSASMLASLAGCVGQAKSSDEDIITIEMYEKKEEQEITVTPKPKLPTWVNFDEKIFMYRKADGDSVFKYKVDLDRFLKDKLELSEDTLENKDVADLIELIYEELGEDLYMTDPFDSRLYNLGNKSVSIKAFIPSDIEVEFEYHYDNNDSLLYEVRVDSKGKTEFISRERTGRHLPGLKYYVRYRGNKEAYSTTILLDESYENYLRVDLSENDGYSITFATRMAEANIKLSEEDYNLLHEIMLSYSDSDNLCEFLKDNIDILNKYLYLIKEKNEEYYTQLCNLINEYIEMADTLSQRTR